MPLGQCTGYYQTTPIGVKNGVDALSKLENHPLEQPVDLILTDINMTKMGGFELIRKHKADQKYQSIPIITLTSDTVNYKL